MYSSGEEEKFEIYMQVHLRKKQDLSDREKIPELEKRLRSKWIHLAVNIAIILLFGYMFAKGHTTFADWFYYLLFGIFALNVLLLTMQMQQIRQLIGYVNHRIERR